MDRAYLLIAGILTGAALGLLTGRPALWICVGVVMGAVLALAARPRPKQPPSLRAIAEGGQPSKEMQP